MTTLEELLEEPLEEPQIDARFLDLQAAVGISKHLGGLPATDELLALCHVADAHEVLNVGCGIGAGLAYMAQHYPCHVVGVDVSEQMIAWSRRRAREAGVAARVDLDAADVLHLPFAANSFDAVICESVLLFVPDKLQAIRECVRVARPGGYVGINEGFWYVRPPAELEVKFRDAIGPCVPTLDEWEVFWLASGLQERLVCPHRVDAREEIRSRLRWIGWPWLLRAWGRGLRIYLTNPRHRAAIKSQFAVSRESFDQLGYVLLAGRK